MATGIDIIARGIGVTASEGLNVLSQRVDNLPRGVNYKGAVPYYKDLPTTNVELGDMYTVQYKGESGTTPNGAEYAWGVENEVYTWIELGKDYDEDIQQINQDIGQLQTDIGNKLNKTTVQGGTAGQVLSKKTGTDYDFEWVDQTGGGSEGALTYKGELSTPAYPENPQKGDYYVCSQDLNITLPEQPEVVTNSPFVIGDTVGQIYFDKTKSQEMETFLGSLNYEDEGMLYCNLVILGDSLDSEDVSTSPVLIAYNFPSELTETGKNELVLTTVGDTDYPVQIYSTGTFEIQGLPFTQGWGSAVGQDGIIEISEGFIEEEMTLVYEIYTDSSEWNGTLIANSVVTGGSKYKVNDKAFPLKINTLAKTDAEMLEYLQGLTYGDCYTSTLFTIGNASVIAYKEYDDEAEDYKYQIQVLNINPTGESEIEQTVIFFSDIGWTEEIQSKDGVIDIFPYGSSNQISIEDSSQYSYWSDFISNYDEKGQETTTPIKQGDVCFSLKFNVNWSTYAVNGELNQLTYEEQIREGGEVNLVWVRIGDYSGQIVNAGYTRTDESDPSAKIYFLQFQNPETHQGALYLPQNFPEMSMDKGWYNLSTMEEITDTEIILLQGQYEYTISKIAKNAAFLNGTVIKKINTQTLHKSDWIAYNGTAWDIIKTPQVNSVNGQTGDVVITVSKENIGLGNVVNTGDSDTPTEYGTDKFTTGGAYTYLGYKLDKTDMQGGTTGQVLKKNSNDDYDFSWTNESGLPQDLYVNGYMVTDPSLTQATEGLIYRTYPDFSCHIEGMQEGYTDVTSIIIPSYVLSDGSYYKVTHLDDFGLCKSLQSITIPNTVEVLEDSCFSECISLASITLPEGLKRIGVLAFNGTPIQSIVIPSTVEEIDSSAFENCSNLATVTFAGIPKIKFIGSNAFLGTAISSFSIPQSVEQFYAGFTNCTYLTTVIFAENSGITELAANFEGCTSLTIIKLPQSIKTLGYHTFYNCTSLTSITLGTNVNYIHDTCFSGCSNLASITILRDDDSTIPINGNEWGAPNATKTYKRRVTDAQITSWTRKQDALPNTISNRYLHTNSSTGALEWTSIQQGIPGGVSGQVLTKNSSTDYDYSWQTPESGGGTYYDLGFIDDNYTNFNKFPILTGTQLNAIYNGFKNGTIKGILLKEHYDSSNTTLHYIDINCIDNTTYATPIEVSNHKVIELKQDFFYNARIRFFFNNVALEQGSIVETVPVTEVICESILGNTIINYKNNSTTDLTDVEVEFYHQLQSPAIYPEIYNGNWIGLSIATTSQQEIISTFSAMAKEEGVPMPVLTTKPDANQNVKEILYFNASGDLIFSNFDNTTITLFDGTNNTYHPLIDGENSRTRVHNVFYKSPLVLSFHNHLKTDVILQLNGIQDKENLDFSLNGMGVLLLGNMITLVPNTAKVMDSITTEIYNLSVYTIEPTLTNVTLTTPDVNFAQSIDDVDLTATFEAAEGYSLPSSIGFYGYDLNGTQISGGTYNWDSSTGVFELLTLNPSVVSSTIYLTIVGE